MLWGTPEVQLEQGRLQGQDQWEEAQGLLGTWDRALPCQEGECGGGGVGAARGQAAGPSTGKTVHSKNQTRAALRVPGWEAPWLTEGRPLASLKWGLC